LIGAILAGLVYHPLAHAALEKTSEQFAAKAATHS
jgi:hypothetical protein